MVSQLKDWRNRGVETTTAVLQEQWLNTNPSMPEQLLPIPIQMLYSI